jgi:hypothetical protein
MNRQYGLPAFFALIAVKSAETARIPKLPVESLKSNQTREGGQDPFDLTNVEQLLKPYTAIVVASKFSRGNKLTQRQDQPINDPTLRGYHGILDTFLAKDLLVSLRGAIIDTCFLKVPTDKFGREMPLSEARTTFQSKFYEFPVLFLRKEESQGILDLARMLARKEYLKFRRTSPAFVNRVVINNASKMPQFLRLMWISQRIETFADNFVGYPLLLVRRNGKVDTETIEPGETSVSCVPVAKYCVGPGAGYDEPIAPCLQATARSPYGPPLGDGFEKCARCGKNDIMSLLVKGTRKTRLLEYLEAGLAERIILGTYAIYATRFGNIVKIGRARETRVVSRLIEQSASDALVYYPIQSLETAATLENKLAAFLKGRLGNLEVRTSVRSEAKVAHITEVSSQGIRYHDLYDKINEIIRLSTDPQIRHLTLIEHRVVTLTENWVLPRAFKVTQILGIVPFERLQCKVTGYAGSLLITDNGLLDWDRLNGYVVRELDSGHHSS